MGWDLVLYMILVLKSIDILSAVYLIVFELLNPEFQTLPTPNAEGLLGDVYEDFLETSQILLRS